MLRQIFVIRQKEGKTELLSLRVLSVFVFVFFFLLFRAVLFCSICLCWFLRLCSKLTLMSFSLPFILGGLCCP